jgi:hypothetical protein
VAGKKRAELVNVEHRFVGASIRASVEVCCCDAIYRRKLNRSLEKRLLLTLKR